MAKTTLHISIPKPCHEDWAKMTPTQCGAFCQACQKEVVDFSRMSEAEIVARLSKASGKVCGRIPATMLNRELVRYEPDHAWYSWKKWAVAAGVLLGVGNVKGSDNAPKLTVQTDTIAQAKLQPIVSASKVDSFTMQDETPLLPLGEKLVIEGRVLNQDGAILPSVSVSVNGAEFKAVTDTNGNYRLVLPAENFYNRIVQLHYSSPMYLDSSQYVLLDSLYNNRDMVLNPFVVEISIARMPVRESAMLCGAVVVTTVYHSRIKWFFRRLSYAFKKKKH